MATHFVKSSQRRVTVSWKRAEDAEAHVDPMKVNRIACAQVGMLRTARISSGIGKAAISPAPQGNGRVKSVGYGTLGDTFRALLRAVTTQSASPCNTAELVTDACGNVRPMTSAAV